MQLRQSWNDLSQEARMLSKKEVEKLKQQIAVHDNHWPFVPSEEYKQWQKDLKLDEDNEALVRRWFREGQTWVGVFENKALDHSRLGDRVGMPFRLEDINLAEI